MLLERFSGNVQRKIVRINDAFYESKVFRHHLLKIVRDKDAAHVQFDVVCMFAVIVEHTTGGSLWDKQDGSECDFSFGNEVNLC